jgi:NAD(P)-dependent dehydrogenase (short-subunit alcohol dehydrogenase family)
VNFVQLDVTDQASVDAAAATLAQAAGHLDVLVNNAGIYVKSGDGAPSVTSPDVMLATYAVNVLGPVRVTNAMLGLLRAAGRANIVMVSSGLGSLHRHLDPASGFARNQTLAYSSSKSALNAITIGYANELREAGFKVNAANPGFVATDLNGRTGTKTTEEGAAIIVELATLGEDGPTGGFFSQNSAEPW